MNVKQLTLNPPDFPKDLSDISPPAKQLFILTANDVNELFARPSVTVIGSRKVSAYGREVTAHLAGELARSGVVIISGLAIGVDSIAHQAALDAGGLTIAVLPSGFEHIYPAGHRGLARQIIEQGGALISEYTPDTPIAYKGNFIARNRIASGLCDAVLITEAAAKSGTLHTAQFAIEQGKEVLAVPGNITSPTSTGTNNLIKSGATPVTSTTDIFHVLGLTQKGRASVAPKGANPNEQTVLDLLVGGTSDGTTLQTQSELSLPVFNQTLTMLEIRGLVRPLGNNQWGLQ
ncbi:MAG TPA: DNA-processing protein DprA [Candidatus Saccharimonadales bacterium]|nr:DNA-processing protein DprA [Candidatus Saccharimonadales bacterium]